MKQPLVEQEVKYLTVPELAQRYRVGEAAVLRWISRGVDTPAGVVRLNAVRVGRRRLIDPADLEAFIQAQNPDTHVVIAEQQEAAARLREQECAALDRQLRRDPNEKE